MKKKAWFAAVIFLLAAAVAAGYGSRSGQREEASRYRPEYRYGEMAVVGIYQNSVMVTVGEKRYSLEMERTKVYDSSGRERNVEELREGMELLVAYTSIQETDPGQIRPQWVEVIGEP